jgi:hypothetical protein
MNLAVLGVTGGMAGVVGSSGARIQGGRNWASQLGWSKSQNYPIRKGRTIHVLPLSIHPSPKPKPVRRGVMTVFGSVFGGRPGNERMGAGRSGCVRAGRGTLGNRVGLRGS